MEQLNSKKDIIRRLQNEILLLEGFKPAAAGITKFPGLEPVESAFPNGVFPEGSVHEFLNTTPEQAAATAGFIAGLLKSLMENGGNSLWISNRRMIFPPALKAFGVEPDHVIFIDLQKEKDVLWTVEEALKCEKLAAVIGEVGQVNFAQSRRLQLAVEKSRVTGFILRGNEHKGATACVARWKINPASSQPEQGMPGVGLPRWQVELLKVRNGNPGEWNMEWSDGFKLIPERVTEPAVIEQTRRTG